ncbi:Outer membrane protein TolC [bacterium A37T11]|nr:Outer membrane protein TolC [bacterium A37T11]
MKYQKYKSKGIHVFILLSLAIGIPRLSNGQEVRHLPLKEAIGLSLENSKDLKITLAKKAEAEAAVTNAKNDRLPDISLSGQYLRMNKPNLHLNESDNNTDDASDDDNSGSSVPNVKEAMFGMANVSIPLYKGGRITYGIKSAQFLAKAAELDAQHDREAVVQNTIEAYYNLYKATAAVRLVAENLKTAEQREKDFARMEENGLLARNDLLKAELQKSNVELSLLDAENNLETANYNFNLMLGLDGKIKLETDSLSQTSGPLTETIDIWEQTALDHRADYLALHERTASYAASVKVEQGAYLPTLSLNGGYIAAKVPNFMTLSNAVNAGLALSYNLSSLYKNGAKVKEARQRELQANWQYEKMRDDVRSQVHVAFQDYIKSLKKIEVYQRAVEQANENYRITKNKHDNALATTTDLLDADVARLQSSINYEYSKADAEVSRQKLNETAGVLLDAQQIVNTNGTQK